MAKLKENSSQQAKSITLSSDYNAVDVRGKKCILKKGQNCLLYPDGKIVSNDGRVAGEHTKIIKPCKI